MQIIKIFYLWSFCWPNYIVTLPRYFSFRLPHLNIPPQTNWTRSQRMWLCENFSHWNGYRHFRFGLNWFRKWECNDIIGSAKRSQINEKYWGEVGKGKRVDVYLEVIFWMKLVPVIQPLTNYHLSFTLDTGEKSSPANGNIDL
jgi:hypothetical protein